MGWLFLSDCILKIYLAPPGGFFCFSKIPECFFLYSMRASDRFFPKAIASFTNF